MQIEAIRDTVHLETMSLSSCFSKTVFFLHILPSCGGNICIYRHTYILKTYISFFFFWYNIKLAWIFKDWSQFLFGSWRNNLNQVVHTVYRVTQGCVQPDWGYVEWTEQIISINPYKLIQTFFVMILKNIFIFSK